MPKRPVLAPGQRLHPGGLSVARLAVQRRGCRIPARRAETQAPGEGLSAVFGRFQDTCEHPGPGLGRKALGKREASCRPTVEGAAESSEPGGVYRLSDRPLLSPFRIAA